ncbi:MAG TPA: hypothetical protein VM076_17400 [Gemmatimonadaceae bacterium]|nr:hypothetical protein [Gemmatimonadaceae bacterium]
MTPLPARAHALVDATIARAGLPATHRAVVRAELEAHFLDGLDAGASLDDLLCSYGDPLLAGSLIARATRRSRAGLGAWLMTASAVVALAYAGGVLRLQSAPSSPAGTALDREAEAVIASVQRAEDLLLAGAEGVAQSYAIAADLRARHTLWAETESVVLLERTLRAADLLLGERARAALADSLAALAERETLAPRRAVIQPALGALTERLFGRDGRVDRAGLRLLRRTKGVTHPSVTASLLEPFYFAPSLSPAEIRRAVEAAVDRRLARADSAARVLAGRVRHHGA